MNKRNTFWEKLLQFWLTPKFPEAHIKKIFEYHPQGIIKQMNNFYRTWFIHPIKRRIAKAYLAFLRRFFHLKVIGIAGSAGKTTTKEMVASILKLRGQTIYSYANIDPVYNIPTTILRCNSQTKFLVLEMGIEYPHEMNFYLWLAKPDISIITNVHPTHTQYLGSIDGVRREKGKIVEHLNKGGIAIINNDCKQCKKIKIPRNVKVMRFGNSGDLMAKDIQVDKDLGMKYTLIFNSNKINVHLPILGRQFVSDSLAAALVGLSLGLPLSNIKEGLERYETLDHRMTPVRLKSGALIIDDSYNNNPGAAKEAVAVLNELKGYKKRIIVFGDMLELGKDDLKLHREIGKTIGLSSVDLLIGVGELCKSTVMEAAKHMGKRATWVKGISEAHGLLKPHLDKKVVIMIKGSRAIGLDQLVEELK